VHAAEEPAGQRRLRQARWRAPSDAPANGCSMSIILHRRSQRAQVQRGGASCSGRVRVVVAGSAAPRVEAANTCGSRSSRPAPPYRTGAVWVQYAASCTCRGRQLEARSSRCGPRGGFPAGDPARRRRSRSTQQTLRTSFRRISVELTVYRGCEDRHQKSVLASRQQRRSSRNYRSDPGGWWGVQRNV